MMDVFSLEDEDCNDLFITQEPKSDVDKEEECGDEIGFYFMDTYEANTEVQKEVYQPQFSDISDDDFEPNEAVLQKAKR